MKLEVHFKMFNDWHGTATISQKGPPAIRDECAGWSDRWTGVHQPGALRTKMAHASWVT